MESVGPRYQRSATLQVSDDVAHFIPPAVPGLSLLPTAGDLLEQSGIDRHGRSFLVGFRMLFAPTEIGPDQIAVAKGRNDHAGCFEIPAELFAKHLLIIFQG